MALMLRMGGVPARVATGFSPGGYSDRKKAWIVRDTDAHAWVEIWFDELRLGHRGPDAGRRRPPARWSARWRPISDSATPGAQADTGADDAASGDASPLSVRPELQTGGVGEVDVARRRGRHRAGGCTRSACVARRWPWCSRSLLFLRRPRGPTPMDRAIAEVEDAMRTGRAAGHDRHDADPARTPARLALARGLGVPACAGRGPLRARSRRRPRGRVGGRCAARWRRGSASAAGCARCGRCRRGSNAGARPPRSRSLEVDTRVRA